jgi:hypothetical protein
MAGRVTFSGPATAAGVSVSSFTAVYHEEQREIVAKKLSFVRI